jgi:hypothetical protein
MYLYKSRKNINFSFLLLIIAFLSLCEGTSAQSTFSFQGNYLYIENRPHTDVFDITPNGKIAVTLTYVSDSQLGGQITSFDPISGVKFDTKFVGFGPSSMKLVSIEGAIRIAVITTQGGPRAVTIYDMNSSGLLTQRAKMQLTSSGNDIGSNLVLSATARVGFTRVAANTGNSTQIVSFSLDDGSILNRITTFSSSILNMYEDASRRIIVSGSNHQLVFIDAKNPSQMVIAGQVTLPGNGPIGSYNMATAFSADGQYLFAADGLSVVNTLTRQVVTSINNSAYVANQLKIFDDGNTRLLAISSYSEDFRGFVLIDASDPTKLSIVSRGNYEQDLYQKRDFTFSQNGKRLYVAGSNSITALSVPTLTTIWDTPLRTAFRSAQIITFGQPERILGAWQSDNNFNATIFSLATIIEADIAPASTGDGAVQLDDVMRIRRFLNMSETPNMLTDEFQRADSAPYATRGDGKIQSNDVVQARRYQNHIDNLQAADGPINNASPSVQEELLNNLESSSTAPHELRIESVTATVGQEVTVNIRTDAFGDEAEYGFALNYDPSILSNPVIKANSSSAGVQDCSINPVGQINCSVGAFSTNQTGSNGFIGEIGAGNNQILLSVTFTVNPNATLGLSQLTFSSVSASNDSAQSLSMISTDGTLTVRLPKSRKRVRFF